MNKLISIIIPVYNVEKYLCHCLDSVINQTYKNLEIILVDDGSTDNSGKICDEYALKDNRIRVIHKQNGGVSSARNAGLDIAIGDYIGFVDSDDYIEPDMYEKLYDLIVRTKSQLSICNYYIEKDKNIVKNEAFPNKELITSSEAFKYFYDSMSVWNKLFKKNIVQNIFFNENHGYGEDFLFCFELLKQDVKVSCMNVCKYYYKQTPNSIMNSHSFKKQNLNFIEILDMQIKYAEEKNFIEIEKKLYKYKIHVLTAWLGFIALESTPDMESVKILLKYIRKNLVCFLITKEKLSKKCFVVVACINFNLASKVYKLIQGKTI